MAKGIDRAVPFRSMTELMKLKRTGTSFIGRYLSASLWKALTLKEAKLIRDAGMFVVTVYQNANNKVQYFSSAYAVKDAKDAVKRALSVGQPQGTPIYFAVDFDAFGAGEIHKIIAYFTILAPIVTDAGYKVGVYGSYDTCHYVKKNVPKVTHQWQTVAWSKGRVIEDVNLYQYKIDTPYPEDKSVGNVDLLKSNGNGGGWKVGT